jgi:hypothetical protein
VTTGVSVAISCSPIDGCGPTQAKASVLRDGLRLVVAGVLGG